MPSAKHRNRSASTDTGDAGETADRELFQYCQISAMDISDGRCSERASDRTYRYVIP